MAERKREYTAWIRDHISAYEIRAVAGRPLLPSMIREGLPDKGMVRRFGRYYADMDDLEFKAALLRCRKERFGQEGEGDLPL